MRSAILESCHMTLMILIAALALLLLANFYLSKELRQTYTKHQKITQESEKLGYLTNENSKTGLYQTFYQGTPTTNMPTTGTAKYVGKAVWADANSVNNNLTAKFDVNFANKNVSGSITDAAKTTIKLNANITGNTFHSPIGADVETHGGFFGNNAAEMSGDFREQKVGGKTGAFGAVKQ